MSAITCRNIEYTPSGRLELTLASDTSSKDLFFNLPPGTYLHPDAILASVGMILARSYSVIDIDFGVSDEMRRLVSLHCQAEVVGGATVPAEGPVEGGSISLAFSGGFDSITARDMLPQDTQLVSLDFGGAFSRERPMFDLFHSNVVKTNLVSLGLNNRSWAFMGIGNLLLRSSLRSSIMSFGTILEAREKYVLRFKSQAQPGVSTLSGLTKMPVVNPVLGLTEVATARHVVRHYPDLVRDVFHSVANPGEAKSYRKSLLLEAAFKESGLTLPRRADLPRTGLEWGRNLAADFLAPYLVKTLGPEAVQVMYTNALPEELIRMAEQLELKFYGRLNTNFYVNSWAPILQPVVSRMVTNDIVPYSSTDYREFSKVASFLNRSFKGSC